MVKKIFKNNNLVATALADDLYLLIQEIEKTKNKIFIAISGGTTPFLLFEILANNFKNKIDWKKIHFFWVDERCVEPTSVVSNYGNTKIALFDKIEIPKENIHRILGENEAELEAKRYSKEIEMNIENAIFDIILLGMGDDGHTASIFPTQIELMNSLKIVEKSQNPYNFQNRITLSGTTINSINNNKRYVRYKVFLSTTDQQKTPMLSNITVNYVSGCSTPGQVIFTGLTADANYAIIINDDPEQTFNNIDIIGYFIFQAVL